MAAGLWGQLSWAGKSARVSGEGVEQLVNRCGGGDVLPPEAIPEPFSKGAGVVVGGLGRRRTSGNYDQLAEGDSYG
jgi:hypothetical protein